MHVAVIMFGVGRGWSGASSLVCSQISIHLLHPFIYFKFHSESVTISVFVLTGSQLKATVTLEGPFASPDVDTGVELHKRLTEFENGRKPNGHLSFNQVVDFEHLNEDIPDDDEAGQENDDILKTPIDPNDPDADRKRRERRERQRQKFLEEKQKREERKMAQLKKVRQDGEPFVHTAKVPIDGWYRMCVTSSWNQVSTLQKGTTRVGLVETNTSQTIAVAHCRLLWRWK